MDIEHEFEVFYEQNAERFALWHNIDKELGIAFIKHFLRKPHESLLHENARLRHQIEMLKIEPRLLNVQRREKMIENRNIIIKQLQKRLAWYKNLDFVLVPKEPTQEMLNAGHCVMNPIKGSDVHPYTNQKRRDCYQAMIAKGQVIL